VRVPSSTLNSGVTRLPPFAVDAILQRIDPHTPACMFVRKESSRVNGASGSLVPPGLLALDKPLKYRPKNSHQSFRLGFSQGRKANHLPHNLEARDQR
jgi:hypothetical protein